MVLIWKQLQHGSFRWPPIMDGLMTLSAVEFAALFDGLDWTRVQAIQGIPSKWGKSPGELGDRPRRSAVGRQKMAEFRALRSDFERMLHLRARTFAPLTLGSTPLARSRH